MTKKFNLAGLGDAWGALVSYVGELRAITSEDEYDRAVKLLDTLLDATRGDDGHVLQGLVALIGDLVEAYELRTLPEASSSPADVLRLLMESNGLKQTDLADVIGGQPVVSAILNGRRQINARQASELGARFGVSPALFIRPAEPGTVRLPGPAATAHGRRLGEITVEYIKAFHKSTTTAPVKQTETNYKQRPRKEMTTSLASNIQNLSLH